MLALVVFRAGIHVFLAVPQHRVDDTGQLVGHRSDSFGHSQLCYLPAQEGGQAQGLGRPAGAGLGLGSDHYASTAHKISNGIAPFAPRPVLIDLYCRLLAFS